MLEVSDIPFGRVLDPMERISETLFGLIMALTFICSLGVATAGNIKIQTMLIGALERFPFNMRRLRRCGSSWRIHLVGRHRGGVRCGSRGPRPSARRPCGATL